ncbi:hypothetical protein BKH42_06930 [Helicobacter sp. 13S00482-2]|uniref:phage late control D family protein n=1 Tax=Helicobacter sp. 13S00482-2 TaxID=1476200 RepID=UPI000BA74E94|nr:hypothetical protein [Helicobacter sp. 13S00482-2]PAF53254.1 hypothetical protein BKH42_06930 [Helicobacter sp. 13S00482-2]
MESNYNYQADGFKITLNDKDISHLILEINYDEHSSNEADTFKFKIFPASKPTIKDEVKFYINANLIGTFYIASIAYAYKTSYELTCTSINFISNFKVKKNRSFDKLSYKQILDSIAKENNLTPKIDFERMCEVVHIDQLDISDSSLCHHIAKDLSLNFCVKNNTLLMLEKDLNKKPLIKINANDCVSLSIESYGKMFYKSVEVSYMDTQNNEIKTIKIGKEEPVFKKSIHSSNDEQAYKKAQSYFKSINANKKKGNLELPGRLIYAGFRLELQGDSETSGIYDILKVSHSITSSSWHTSVEFG